MWLSPRFAISRSATLRTLARACEARTSVASVSFGKSSTACMARAVTPPTSASSFCRTGTARPSSWRRRATRRWAGVTSELRRSAASACAAATASCDLTVKRSGCIRAPPILLVALFKLCDPSLEVEDPLDPGEVQPFGGELLDPLQQLDIALRVEARVLRRALRLDQPPGLVHAQGLRVHLGQVGGDRDHEDAPLRVDRSGDRFAPDAAHAAPAAHRAALLSRSARGSPPFSASAS